MQLKLVSKKEAKEKLNKNGMKETEINNLISKTRGRSILFGTDREQKFSTCVIGNKAGSSKRCRYGQPEEKVKESGKKVKVFEDSYNENRGFAIAFSRVFQK